MVQVSYQKPNAQCLKLFREILNLPQIPEQIWVKPNNAKTYFGSWADNEKWIKLDCRVDSKHWSFLYEYYELEPALNLQKANPDDLVTYSTIQCRVEMRRHDFVVDGKQTYYFLGKSQPKLPNVPILCFWQ